MKSNIFGMPTLIELKGIEENIKLCRSLDLDFIELNMNLPEYQPEQIEVEKLKHFKEQYNIFYTIHLPEEFDIANFNSDINNAYEKVFSDTVAIAKQLECPILNMHMNAGVYFKLPGQRIYLYDKYFDEYMEKITEFKDFVEKLLSGSETILAIENTGIYDRNYIKAAVDKLLVSDKIHLTWDIGHDHSSGNKDYNYLMENQNKLVHMHIHDAINENNHLPLFTGDINIQERMKIAQKHGCRCVIETKTVDGLIASVRSMRENLGAERKLGNELNLRNL